MKYPDVPLITWDDEIVGQAQLGVVRKLGLPGRVARVFLVQDEAVLLQERSSTVDSSGVMDCSAEGWVDMADLSVNGEPGDYPAAAIRETNEELGLTVARNDLATIGHYLLQKEGVSPPEWTTLFVAEYNPPVHGSIRCNDEVAGTQWLDVYQAQDWANSEPQQFEAGAPLALNYLIRSLG